jgi:hypothetical protein
VTRLLEPQPRRRPERTIEQPADTSRLAGWVARLPEGNRNDGLFWAANRALDAGVTDLAGLADAARSTGLDEREIARTFTSARHCAAPSLGADPPASRTPEPASRPPETERPVPGSPHRATRSQPDRGPEAEAS